MHNIIYIPVRNHILLDVLKKRASECDITKRFVTGIKNRKYIYNGTSVRKVAGGL